MRVRITLFNSGNSELDRKVIEIHGKGDSAEASEAIHDAIKDWGYSVGDTIVIQELGDHDAQV
jgi:hypothetical protein